MKGRFAALSSRQAGLLALAGVLLAFILLSGSLPNLEFHQGTPFPGGVTSIREPGNAEPEAYSSIRPGGLLQGGLAVIFLLLLIYIPYRLVSQVNLKQVLRWGFVFGFVAVLVILLPAITPGDSTFEPGLSETLPAPESFEYRTAPLGQPPHYLDELVVLLLVVGAVSIAVVLARAWLQPSGTKAALQQEAELAVQSLKTNTNFENVILRCYMRMSDILQQEQGIERDQTMTVREFEAALETKGFPVDPVCELSSLFEKVRYGRQQLCDEDERAAMESLNAIIEFCGRDGR